MIASREAIRLRSLNAAPSVPGAGDMYICRRLGIVKVMNGHKRGMHNKRRCVDFHLYHFGKLSLIGSPSRWRDDDPNLGKAFDPSEGRGEKWQYVGNIADWIPFNRLSATVPEGL